MRRRVCAGRPGSTATVLLGAVPVAAVGGAAVWRGAWAVSVRRRRVLLSPGEGAERERAIWDVLAEDERAALALLLERLGRSSAGWYGWPLVRRPAELLAWRALTSQAEQRGMTRRAAEDAAARQLGQHPDTLRSRLR